MEPPLGRAFAMFRQTMPYVLYRMLVYGALCGCVLVYLCLLALIGMVFGSGAFWVLAVLSALFAAVAGISGFVSEYVFYQPRAGHMALITEIIGEGQLPVGISQAKWARGRVVHYFEGMRLLPEVRRLVKETLRAVNGTLFDTTPVMPAPGLEGNTKLARQIVRLSQGYVEEAVVAYVFKTRNENVFEGAKMAVLLYCQCWKSVLGQAVTLTLLSYAFALVASVVFLIPLALVGALLIPHDWTVVRFTLFAIGVFLGFTAKWALFDPLACTATVLTFFGETDILALDAEWAKQVESVAPAFVELKQKAAEKAGENVVKKEGRRPRTRRPIKE